MKGIILLANKFEDCEAFITIDLLRRAGITIDLVSLEQYELIGSNGINVKAEYLINEVVLEDYDFVVLPGGKAIYEYHLTSDTASIINYFYQANKLICAICAAPLVLASIGILDSHEFTCFPTEKENCNINNYQDKAVVLSKNIITSKALGTTFDFALEIIKYLLGDEKSIEIKNQIFYKK